jgi:hypothetical protein
LKAHWDVLAAVDFTTIEVWGLKGLVTMYLLFVMEVDTARALGRLHDEPGRSLDEAGRTESDGCGQWLSAGQALCPHGSGQQVLQG